VESHESGKEARYFVPLGLAGYVVKGEAAETSVEGEWGNQNRAVGSSVLAHDATARDLPP